MTALVEFEVLGVPAPQGSKTAITIGGKARLIEGGSDTGRTKHRAWRTAVAEAARDVAADQTGPFDGPLFLSITFRFPMPKSRPVKARRAGRWPHMVKPDIDKVLRATADGLTAGGLIADDSRICAVECEAWEVVGWTGAVITVGRQTPFDLAGRVSVRRLQLTAADLCAAAIGGLIGMGLALGVAESWLRKAARR